MTMPIYHVSLLSLTAALKSLSKSFKRYPTKSPNSHFPILICALFLTKSSTLFSSSLAMISPAVFLHVGLAISSFIPSIFAYYFCSTSRIFTKSPASLSSCDFMYSRMYFSPYLKVSSMMKSSLSLRFLNSSEITLYMRELKFYILMFILAISLRTFTPRLSRHWEDQMRADQKLVLYETRPVQIQFWRPSLPFTSAILGRSSKSSSELNLLSVNPTPCLSELVCSGTNRGLVQRVVVGSSGAQVLGLYSSKYGWFGLVGVSLLSPSLSLDLLLLLLFLLPLGLVGELVNREFFLRKVRRLLSVLLIDNKIQYGFVNKKQLYKGREGRGKRSQINDWWRLKTKGEGWIKEILQVKNVQIVKT